MLILALLGVNVLSAEHVCPLSPKHNCPCSWECMMLALMWPGAFCVTLKYNSSACIIPEYIQNWTIHGLWPMVNGKGCECWPIFPSDLQELEPELSQLWPSLINRERFIFWRNEWIKHGSCAACKEGMNSPTRYFQMTLKLYRRFNIDQVLNTAGIVPSCNNPYKISDLHEVLDPVLGNKHEIQCVKDDAGRQVWVQVKIPLYHNFTLGCHRYDQEKIIVAQSLWSSSPGHPCPPNTPIFYFPINYKEPDHPCD
ncbi:ribonuclease Oy-like [Arapaima gigas]